MAKLPSIGAGWGDSHTKNLSFDIMHIEIYIAHIWNNMLQ